MCCTAVFPELNCPLTIVRMTALSSQETLPEVVVLSAASAKLVAEAFIRAGGQLVAGTTLVRFLTTSC